MDGLSSISNIYIHLYCPPHIYNRSNPQIASFYMQTNSNTTSLVTTTPTEYLKQKYLFDRLAMPNRSTYFKTGNLICQPKFELVDWVGSQTQEYHAMAQNEVIGTFRDVENGLSVFGIFLIRKNNFTYGLFGDKELVCKLVTSFEEDSQFRTQEVTIQWAFGKSYRDMETIEIPLEIKPRIPDAFPWLGCPLEEYVKNFLLSSESILMLMGPPGTGKTSFIKELIRESGKGAMVTYDTELLFTDGFFASFISDENNDILVLEDADNNLGHRKEGNEIMHRFLNTSDGLASLQKKKIIFTANITNLEDIDPALLRKGRCYDIVHARNMTKQEALKVAKYLNPQVEESLFTKQEYSLTEVINAHSKPRTVTGRVKAGFFA